MDEGRYGAVDVHYPPEGGARAALVVAGAPDFSGLIEERLATLATVAQYCPGRFFERELPALQAVLSTTQPLRLLIVDGYVDLDPDGRPGLGAHVFATGLVPVVVGVAKTAFHAASHAVPVLRGAATRPLFVTAAGMGARDAAALVSGMAGTARIPDALRRVDRLARHGL